MRVLIQIISISRHFTDTDSLLQIQICLAKPNRVKQNVQYNIEIQSLRGKDKTLWYTNNEHSWEKSCFHGKALPTNNSFPTYFLHLSSLHNGLTFQLGQLASLLEWIHWCTSCLTELKDEYMESYIYSCTNKMRSHAEHWSELSEFKKLFFT